MKKKNTLVKFALCLVLVCVLIVGCTSAKETQEVVTESDQGEEVVEEEVTEEAVSEEEPLVIAIALNDLDESQVNYLRVYQETCDEYGYELIYTNAGGSIEKQISDVESLMVQEPDVIGIQALDSVALADIADEVYSIGIPVASVYYGIDSENVVSIGGGDVYERGYIQGRLIKQFLTENPEETLYAGFMWGSLAMDVTQILYDGMIGAINEDPDVASRFIILDEQDTNWSAEEALNVTEDWLQTFPEMNCIVAQADQMCAGGVAALEAAGEDLSQWYVFGQDLKAESVELVQNGSMFGSVFMDYPSVSRFVIETLAKVAAGEVTKGESTALEGAYVEVTAENLEQYIDYIIIP